jgi:hypothetical protein
MTVKAGQAARPLGKAWTEATDPTTSPIAKVITLHFRIAPLHLAIFQPSESDQGLYGGHRTLDLGRTGAYQFERPFDFVDEHALTKHCESGD